MKQTYIALLRGINVGGRNKLPMATLREIVTRVGGDAVQTYIQSGNVVFQADHEVEHLADALRRGIADTQGLDIPIVLLKGDEFRTLLGKNPFLTVAQESAEEDEVDIKTLHVGFLADSPTGEQIAGLNPDHSPPDSFHVAGRAVYLRYPKGLARSKLTNAYFDRRLQTVCTVRNWKTCLKLLEMLEN